MAEQAAVEAMKKVNSRRHIRRDLQKARRVKAGLYRRYERSLMDGRRDSARNLQRLIMQSKSVKFVAVCEAYRKMKRGARRRVKASFWEIATSVDCMRPCGETVIVHGERKASGDIRPIFHFGIQSRSRQIIVADLLRPTFLTHQSQSMSHGGVPAAIEHVKKHAKEGYVYASRTDISAYFQSFRPDRLHTFLKLPKEVIDAVAMTEGYELSLSDDLDRLFNEGEKGSALADAFLEEARRGIPHGSCTSTVIAEKVMADVLPLLSADVQLVNHGDDTLILGKSAKDVASTISDLRIALKQHPAGLFQLTHSIVHSPGTSFKFLGADITIRPAGSLLVKVSSGNRQKLAIRVKRKAKQIAALNDPLKREIYWKRALRRLNGWQAAFKYCCDADQLAEWGKMAVHSQVKAQTM
ncbi:hypothetical protein [Afipia sp. 1NLS2]|uniref:hypothetical protein n=1 Tax=Afipia sp. 1NLS2 TaxID=666684 RepID=UPI0001D9E6BF|nr:hypothetical protein [Afipia sp. 1NLS2]EFI52000.1 hypothetical protein AfiDRAFT_2286 [Afipia sp. 1NLS2]